MFLWKTCRQHVHRWRVQTVQFAACLHCRVPADLGPGQQLILQPRTWRCMSIHLFSSATNCLTVISPQTAFKQILIATSSSHYVLYQLLIVDKQSTPPWITRLIKTSVFHTFQSDWRCLKQSMSVNEKHVYVEGLLFTDNFCWRASIQLMLACGPADLACLALILDCNIKSSK